MLKHLSTNSGEWNGSKALPTMLEGVSGQFHIRLFLSGEDILLPVCHQAEQILQPTWIQQQREISLPLPRINPGHPASQLITLLTDLSHLSKATNTALFTNRDPLHF